MNMKLIYGTIILPKSIKVTPNNGQKGGELFCPTV